MELQQSLLKNTMLQFAVLLFTKDFAKDSSRLTLTFSTPEPTAATIPLPSAPRGNCCTFRLAANLQHYHMGWELCQELGGGGSFLSKGMLTVCSCCP